MDNRIERKFSPLKPLKYYSSLYSIFSENGYEAKDLKEIVEGKDGIWNNQMAAQETLSGTQYTVFFRDPDSAMQKSIETELQAKGHERQTIPVNPKNVPMSW